MSTYTVIGYERTVRMMRVDADSEDEAVEKAKRGDFDAVDTEPGPYLMRPAWRATEGWHLSRPTGTGEKV